ncbi:MAG: hypothetical protein COB62_02375 [Piscirickettsiaceae bacterium]|nr:MAG: hypothetical protein COB62_02375 [Piscirickettsiaceae bacterium]
MIIEEIMTKAVVCGQMTDTVNRLEQVMKEAGVRYLPIVDNAAQCVGTVSAVDLVRVHNLKRSMNNELQAWQFFSEPVVEVGPYQPVIEAIELMVVNKAHHLVVIGNEGVVGVVSSIDILEKYVLQN